MFGTLALDGLWLLGALLVAFVLGVAVSQKLKDLLSGVPGELRTVLKNAEAGALAKVQTAKTQAVADVAKVTSAMPAVAKPVVPAAPVVPPAPVAAQAGQTA